MGSFVLPTGEKVIVDDEDLDAVMAHSWRALRMKSGEVYVRTNIYLGAGKEKHVRLHRMLLNAPEDKSVDHINGNALDNRRANLRLVSNSENHRAFKRKPQGCSSRFRGVSWDRRGKKWRAALGFFEGIKRRYVGLGSFSDEIEAAKAYNAGALAHGFLPEALNQI